MKIRLLIALAMVLGCEEQAARQGEADVLEALDPANDINVSELSLRSVGLGRVVAIHESEFGRLLSAHAYGAAERTDVNDTLAFAALANSPDALGITGTLISNTSVTEQDLLVVMENPFYTPQGVLQATRFHFASIRINGAVAWVFRDVRLHFNTALEAPASCASWRGCRPSPVSGSLRWAHSSQGGAGLPSGTLFDAETNARPQTAAGHPVEFRVYSGSDIELPAANRFLCAGQTNEQACAPNKGDSVLEAAQDFDKQDIGSVVVDEHDFERWIQAGELRPRPVTYGKEAAIAVAKLNHPSSIGIASTTLAQGSPTATLVFVVRNPFRIDVDGRLEGRTVFVIPGPLRLPNTIFGTYPRIAFDGPVPQAPWRGGVCGPVLTPGPVVNPSWIGGYGFNPTQSHYGTNRFALSKARSTVRVPFTHNGAVEIQKLACSIYEPPTPQPQPICVNGFNPITGTLIQEECNGVDDNCNGQVDEAGLTSDPCEVPLCETCIPISCGTTRCTSLPDGCGQVIACPCP